MRQYFHDKEDVVRNSHIVLAGDFNFPRKIVEWKDSSKGVVANFTEGEGIQKVAFERLLELTEDLQMEQIVNQPTRGKNILDLVFTNQPHIYTECSTQLLKPQSDHKLVNFMFTNPTTINEEDAEASSQIVKPEIATFNFKNCEKEVKEKLNEELDMDWRRVLRITPTDRVETLSKRFIAGMVHAAKRAKVPKYPVYSKEKRMSLKHEKLVEKRKTLESQASHSDVTNRDKEEIEEKIVSINKTIQDDHEQERVRKEEEAVSKIKTEPKEFFRYTNRTKKSKSRIGPLRSGESYYSGPREMARILSEQYKLHFSKPKSKADYEKIVF